VSRVISFAAELWLYDGDSGWHFVSVPLELSRQVREESDHVRRGFGSLKVRATIGGSTWETSVFPSSTGSYLLPVKKPVRRDEGLEGGDVVEVRLELLDL
jgi:hypothetical protein